MNKQRLIQMLSEYDEALPESENQPLNLQVKVKFADMMHLIPKGDLVVISRGMLREIIATLEEE